GPVSDAAAQRCGGLEFVGVPARLEIPCAQICEDPVGHVVPVVRIALDASGELVATRSFQRPVGGATELGGLVGQVDVHDAARSARANRILCISMLPDATVAAWEYRQWSSTARRNHSARAVSKSVVSCPGGVA